VTQSATFAVRPQAPCTHKKLFYLVQGLLAR
jgi:hypothetical protein